MPTLALKRNEAKEKNQEPLIQPAITDLKSLANKLIQQASQLPASDTIYDDGETEEGEVLLDMEIEGVRCLILRTHSKMASATVMLSPREQEIAGMIAKGYNFIRSTTLITRTFNEERCSRMIAKGYPNKTIAAVLDISAWTVCTHIRRVFAKLGVGSRAEMVAKLLEKKSLNGSTPNAQPHSFK